MEAAMIRNWQMRNHSPHQPEGAKEKIGVSEPGTILCRQEKEKKYSALSLFYNPFFL
jgi:hypothetical protein